MALGELVIDPSSMIHWLTLWEEKTEIPQVIWTEPMGRNEANSEENICKRIEKTFMINSLAKLAISYKKSKKKT